jgi:hypothetical protein
MTGVFFVHVMKTGGVSLGRMLRSELPGPVYPDTDAGQGPETKLGVDRIVSLPREQRAAVGLFTVHMPAWVAEEVAPSHLRVTLLREPVERTISHLKHITRMKGTPNDPEEVYADDGWRSRLTDLQTRLFADTVERYRQRREAAATMRERMPPAASRRALGFVWSTGAPDARALDETDLAVAVARLETFDVVGVTSDMAGIARRIGARLGLDLPMPEHENRAPSDAGVSPALRARIEADTALDAQLFRRARALASQD